MTLSQGTSIIPCNKAFTNFPSSASVEGFWAHGLSKDGAIRVGEDDEGA